MTKRTETAVSPASVRQYLIDCYEATLEELDTALTKPESVEEIAQAMRLGSYLDFPGDRIAAREGWVFDEDTYIRVYDPEEEE